MKKSPTIGSIFTGSMQIRKEDIDKHTEHGECLVLLKNSKIVLNTVCWYSCILVTANMCFPNSKYM